MRGVLCLLLVPLLLFSAQGGARSQESGGTPRESALDRMLDIAGVKVGMLVGEIGAGTGDLALAMAARVGASGRVYANDISQAAVKYIADRKIPNVVTVLGTTDDPAFPRRDLDLAIMKNTFHDLENPLSLLENARTYLKPGAPLVIIEPTTPPDAASDAIAFHDMTANQILGIVSKSSFRVARSEKVGAGRARMSELVLQVVPDKVARVWSNWLAEFRAAVDHARRFESAPGNSNDRKRIAWERVLDAHRDDAPGTDDDERLREEIRSRIVSLRNPAGKSTTGTGGIERFRSVYRRLAYEDIEAIVTRLGFAASVLVRDGDYVNQYERLTISGDPVVADQASGLLWHASGSDAPLDYFAAQDWIDHLNSQRYGGRSNWRLPTVDELLTLLETRPPQGRARVDARFSDAQVVIWTGDDSYPGRAWVVNFGRTTATVWEVLKIRASYVRPVTTM